MARCSCELVSGADDFAAADENDFRVEQAAESILLILVEFESCLEVAFHNFVRKFLGWRCGRKCATMGAML